MKVSIVTTTYNNKEFIKECVESVQQLRLEPLDIEIEHIVYDDASTDGTEELFNKIKYSNLHYIKGEVNKGPAQGRNIAIEKSSGEYIFVLDGDDIILQRTVHNFARQAIKNPDVDWFVSDFLRVNKELKYCLGQDYFGWHFNSKIELLEAIFKGDHFIQHNVFFKKSLFVKVGGYSTDMRMAEDLDLFVRFIMNESMPVYLDFISHLHRSHENNLSKNIDLEAHKKDALMISNKYKTK